MAVVLSDILNEVTSQNLNIDDAIQGIGAAYDEAKEANTTKAAAVMDAGGNAAIVARTSEQGALLAQTNAREIAAHLGTNKEAGTYRMLELADQMTRSYDMANAELDKIHAKKAVSPIKDGPLKYLAAQLSVKSDIERHNYAADKYNIASNTLEDLNAATQTATRTQYDIAMTRNAASVDAKSEMELDKARALAADIKAQNAMYDVDRIRTVQAMDGQQLDNKFKAYNAEATAEQRAFMNEQRQQVREEAAARLKLAQDAKSDFSEIASVASIGAQTLGYPAMSEAQVRQYTKLGGSTAEKIRKFIDVGAIRIATGEIVIGDNAGDAARLLNSTKAPLVPAKQQAKDFINTAYSQAMSGEIPGVDTKSIQSIDAAVQNQVNTVATNQMNNIKKGDASNIYQAPDVQTLAKNSSAVAESALYQKVLRPVATGVTSMESDPDRIARLALQAVKKGDITFDEATMGVSSYFRAATELNIATKGYRDLHIPEPEQSAYKVKLSPTGWGYSSRFNMSDPKDVIRLMVLMQIDSATDYNLFEKDPRENPSKGAN